MAKDKKSKEKKKKDRDEKRLKLKKARQKQRGKKIIAGKAKPEIQFIKKYAEDVGRKPEDESIPAEGWK